MLGDDRKRPERAAEAQRSDVAHKNISRIGIEPKETERSAEHRPADHGEFTRALKIQDLKVLGKFGVAGDVDEDHVREKSDPDKTYRQSVDSVRQVDRV